MKFTKKQLRYFGAIDGAWSEITQDERDHSQINISEDSGETEVAIKGLGKANIPRTPLKRRTLISTVTRNGFLNRGELLIQFPKTNKDELRIYRNETNGFDYEAGDIWFIHRNRRQLTVGSMPRWKWETLGREDQEDSQFQATIETSISGTPSEDTFYQTASGLRIKRDPRVALKALKRAKFRCEYDPKAKLFLSRVSGQSYVEAHHFIPLSAKTRVRRKLDIEDNIVSLSPYWHRAIHHAEDKLVREILTSLARKRFRAQLLKDRGLTLSDLFELYFV